MKNVPTCLPFCSLILVMTVLPLAANPVEDGFMLTHVQPYNQDAPILLDCSQVDQYCPASGWVDFDFYVYLMYESPPYGVDACRIVFTWPAEWSFDVGWYDYPHSGTGDIDVYGNQATVEIMYPSCPSTAGELFLLMRCSFYVTSYGAVEILDYENLVDFCDPWGWMSGLPSYGGEAGIVCEYDEVDCDLDHYCHPEAQTPLLTLQGDPGEPLSADLVFELCPASQGGCSLTFTGTEDWMSISVGEFEEGCNYPVTLEIDTSTLPPGDYSGWVEAEDLGAGCTRVDLTIRDMTGVDGSSWSLIKTLY